MNTYQSTLLLASLVLSAQLQASGSGVDVIYGEDNRQDVYASENSSFVELSKSTAGMIHEKTVFQGRNETKIIARTLSERGVCEEERFANQITAASCSGFLVAKNLLVTAGHCIRSSVDCKAYKWVFDYKVDHADQGEVTVPISSVYSCSKIISRSLNYASQDDYALIELDRDVTDRQPLAFRRSGRVEKDTPLVVIGHPTGLPTKIADGAKVRSLAGKYFIANLDTFGGNSGSAVFNADTLEVEGILVRGETDYVQGPGKGCQVSKRCSDSGCRGEDVTYITNVAGLEDIE